MRDSLRVGDRQVREIKRRPSIFVVSFSLQEALFLSMTGSCRTET